MYKPGSHAMTYRYKPPLAIVPEHQVGDWDPGTPSVCSYQCLSDLALLGDGLLLVSDMILSMDTQDLHMDLATIIPSFVDTSPSVHLARASVSGKTLWIGKYKLQILFTVASYYIAELHQNICLLSTK